MLIAWIRLEGIGKFPPHPLAKNHQRPLEAYSKEVHKNLLWYSGFDTSPFSILRCFKTQNF